MRTAKLLLELASWDPVGLLGEVLEEKLRPESF